MNINGIKEQTGTLKKLHNLLGDSGRTVHGVFYTNSFFSQRYLCRSHVLVDNINIEDETIKLTLATRLEKIGLMEIENTLEMLVKHEAGDLPGFSPEGMFDDPHVDQPFVAEAISVKQHLYSVDLLLIVKEPTVTYQEFTIAGSKFALVNLKHRLEDDFEQTITILFGESDKLYFFSHFFDKELNVRDTKMILDLIIDENITGKAIKGIKIDSVSGVTSTVFPFDELINSYSNSSKDIVFGTGAGYIRIPQANLGDYKLKCVPTEFGQYRLDLIGKKDTIHLYME